jgi:DhnA family fructose-bisphosphate aldolase class Ia
MNRIFRPDGRALIVAMDHGLIDGPTPGLERPDQTIAKVAAGGADAVLTSYGVARRFARELAPLGLILRVDGGATSLGAAGGPGATFFGVEEALRLGADAVAVSAFPGSPVEVESLARLAHVIAAAHAWGLPVMAEMVPGGFDSPPEKRTLDAISISARVAAELGADFVKIPFVAGFERVVQTCYVPVVVLGGKRKDDPRVTFEMLRASLQAGGAGAVIGRNIWQSPHPTRMAAALSAMIHGNADVDVAMDILAG